MKRWTPLGLVLLFPGCGESSGERISDVSGDDAGYSESSVGPVDPDSATTVQPPSVTTDTGDDSDSGALTDGTTGTTGSSSSGGDTSTDDTGEEPVSVCDPQPEGAPYWLKIDWNEEEPFIDETIELDVACSVWSADVVAGILSIELVCSDAVHVLDLADLGPIDLAMGDEVTLRVHDSQPWWRQTHVTLLRDGVVIVAGMAAESLPSGDSGPYSPAGTFFDPLGVEVVQGVCKPEPVPEEDPGCTFLCSPPCTQDERRALRFTSGGMEAVVYDGMLGSVDGLALSVGTARAHVEVLCSDTPGGWYSFLAVRTL
jgi:hypothetical protein